MAHWSGWPKVGSAVTVGGTLAIAIGTLGALYFTNQSLRATNDQLGISQQTAVTDRFRLASEQLAHEKISVRISGIYLLERLAKDSLTDHDTIYAVLAAFVRTEAPAVTDSGPCTAPKSGMGPADVHTAMTVIGRRDVTAGAAVPELQSTCLSDIHLSRAHLANADLASADLTGADLFGANLTSADLASADLFGANLTGANLFGADLTGANLTGADLASADLAGADLFGANLTSANLASADLFGANLTGANLASANLASADLASANLTGANLTGANLTGTDLTGTNLTNTVLTDVRYDESTRWPADFTPPPSR